MYCGGGHPFGKNVSKRFYSEATWSVETKLPRNDHWKVLYKFYVFYADWKSKMAATAIHSNVKLSPAVAAILNFIPEQKT
jgi:hypothetical protein